MRTWTEMEREEYNQHPKETLGDVLTTQKLKPEATKSKTRRNGEGRQQQLQHRPSPVVHRLPHRTGHPEKHAARASTARSTGLTCVHRLYTQVIYTGRYLCTGHIHRLRVPEKLQVNWRRHTYTCHIHGHIHRSSPVHRSYTPVTCSREAASQLEKAYTLVPYTGYIQHRCSNGRF
jgi:hypothetical protein